MIKTMARTHSKMNFGANIFQTIRWRRWIDAARQLNAARIETRISVALSVPNEAGELEDDAAGCRWLSINFWKFFWREILNFWFFQIFPIIYQNSLTSWLENTKIGGIAEKLRCKSTLIAGRIRRAAAPGSPTKAACQGMDERTGEWPSW